MLPLMSNIEPQGTVQAQWQHVRVGIRSCRSRDTAVVNHLMDVDHLCRRSLVFHFPITSNPFIGYDNVLGMSIKQLMEEGAYQKPAEVVAATSGNAKTCPF